MEKTAQRQVNKQFRIFSALAMILAVMGQMGDGMLTIGRLFPYCSFHIALFLFITGYFYRPEKEEQIGAYLMGKARSLPLPYFIWNRIYGLIVMALQGRIGLPGKKCAEPGGNG